MKTEKLVAALRRVAAPFGCINKCKDCSYRVEVPLISDDFRVCNSVRLHTDAADKIEELVERCARYVEEIAVLRQTNEDLRDTVLRRDT